MVVHTRIYAASWFSARTQSVTPLQRLPSLQESGPPGEQGKRRRVVGGERVDQEAAIRRDIVLEHGEVGGDNARLEKHARRAGGPLLWVELDRHQLPVGSDVEDLPAVAAPTGLSAAFAGDWNAPAGAREGLHEDVPGRVASRPGVSDPLSILGELAFCPGR